MASQVLKPAKRGTFSQRLKKTISRDWQYYLLMLLPFAYIVIFAYVPMFGLQIAFRKYTAKGGIWGSEWVGFANFEKFFKSYQFERVVSNTVIISLYSLVAGTIFPVVFALMINSIDSLRFRKITHHRESAALYFRGRSGWYADADLQQPYRYIWRPFL